jgi:hypothetical protein
MVDKEQNYAHDLGKVREEGAGHQEPGSVNNAAGSGGGAVNVAKRISPWQVFALLKQASLLRDMPFVAALMFALLKDLLDLIFNETVILGILFSILCCIFVYMMMLLAGFNDGLMVANGLTKGIMLIGGGITDSLPGIGFAPVATMTVMTIYILTLSDRANAEK